MTASSSSAASSRTPTTNDWAPLRSAWFLVAVGVLTLSIMTTLVVLQQPAQPNDAHTIHLVIPKDDTTSAAVAKPHPPKPKKLHHGTVEYFAEDTADGRRYRREFTIPCHYGMVVFQIGPASTDLPFDFDVYDDAYIYSDNSGLCVLYPSYRGYQNATHPFWLPDDPTRQKVPLSEWAKISHRIQPQPHTKPVTDAIQARGGDYVIMEKGNFYDPHYYQQIKAIVNSWSAANTSPLEMEEQLNHFVLQNRLQREQSDTKTKVRATSTVAVAE